LSYGIGSNFSASSFEPHATLTAFAIYAPQNLARLEQGIQERWRASIAKASPRKRLNDAKTGMLQARRLRRAQDARSPARSPTACSWIGTLAFDAKVVRDIQALNARPARAGVPPSTSSHRSW